MFVLLLAWRKNKTDDSGEAAEEAEAGNPASLLRDGQK